MKAKSKYEIYYRSFLLSGLSISEYCEQNNLNRHNFYHRKYINSDLVKQITNEVFNNLKNESNSEISGLVLYVPKEEKKDIISLEIDGIKFGFEELSVTVLEPILEAIKNVQARRWAKALHHKWFRRF